jgi:hypothetical protein
MHVKKLEDVMPIRFSGRLADGAQHVWVARIVASATSLMAFFVSPRFLRRFPLTARNAL